eukprot:jgi/Galph1/2570/GphlegSOOS_G1252.1
MKAAGMSATSIYFVWSYHSPKSHVYNFEGIRDLDKLFKMVNDAGIYLIARPAPYRNAETSWWFSSLVCLIIGLARTDNHDYTAAWKQWLSVIDPYFAKHQCLYGGPIIGYMKLLEAKSREDGTIVPLTANVYGDRSNWASGPGAVDIQGIDSYPQGFDCSNTSKWHPIPTYFATVHADYNPNEPMYNPEYQGGSFDPWHGPGYHYCYGMTNSDFEKVFYQNQIAQG